MEEVIVNQLPEMAFWIIYLFTIFWWLFIQSLGYIIYATKNKKKLNGRFWFFVPFLNIMGLLLLFIIMRNIDKLIR